VNSRRPWGFWRAGMGYFLWRSIKTPQSNRFSAIAPQSFLLAYCPSKCMTLANRFLPNPLANAGLTLRPKFPFLHQLQTRVPLRNTPTDSLLESRYSSPSPRHLRTVIPTGAAAQFAAAEWRDPGNQSSLSQFDPPISSTGPRPPLSTYSLFLSIPFIFPLVEMPFSI
jgi:hypothetical protein